MSINFRGFFSRVLQRALFNVSSAARHLYLTSTDDHTPIIVTKEGEGDV